MVKIAFIGDSGHGANFTINGIEGRENEVKFVGAAPGSKGESIKFMPSLARFGGTNLYDDYKEMLRVEKPDLVVVDNYYAQHAPIVVDAFNAGCHVFCEKPIASTLEELDDIYYAWQQAGTRLTSMLNFRYTGSFYKAWQLIQEGAIGDVRLLNAQKSYKMGTRPQFTHRRENYAGTIPWVGIHGIDWIAWMSGRKFVSATALQTRAYNGGNGSLETNALVQYQLEDDVMASLTIDYFNPPTAPRWGDDRIRVVGTKGVLEVKGPDYLTLINGDAEGIQQLDCPAEQQMFPDFLDEIQGKGQCRVTAEASFIATEAAIRAQMAADTHTTVYF